MTKAEVCRYLVLYHHLNGNQLIGHKGVLDYINQVGSIQFDPLDQVGNNPHLVLQDRIKGYKSNILRDLLYKERVLLDGWDKCLSIYSCQDWIKFRRYHDYTKAHDRFVEDQGKHKEQLVKKVVEEIQAIGPVSSSDIDFQGKMDWHWAPTSVARATLEYMYYAGDLLIHHKNGTRKYYDLMSKYFSEEFLKTEDGFSAEQDFFTWLVYRRIKAVGILWNKASHAFIGMRGFKAKHRLAAFDALSESNLILPIEVEGQILYIPANNLALLESVKTIKLKSWVHFFAPLDNMLWDRKLIQYLFDFDYKWEVYTPKADRLYGYYVLPILFKDRLVGRFEPMYDKKTKILSINKIWYEDGFVETKLYQKSFQKALKEFANYLGGELV